MQGVTGSSPVDRTNSSFSLSKYSDSPRGRATLWRLLRNSHLEREKEELVLYRALSSRFFSLQALDVKLWLGMAYTLISSERSPFGRICRMFMIRHGIDFQFRALNFVDDKNDALTLAQETPINKVPILVDDGQKIFDSRVIVNYLTRKHGLPALSIAEENLVSAVYSCLDTGVILFLMKRDGFDIDSPGFFLRRNRERIPSNLNFLATWVDSLDPANPRDWNYASISLFSFLYWAEARAGFLDVNSFPAHAAFMTKFANAPGVKETGF